MYRFSESEKLTVRAKRFGLKLKGDMEYGSSNGKGSIHKKIQVDIHASCTEHSVEKRHLSPVLDCNRVREREKRELPRGGVILNGSQPAA